MTFSYRECRNGDNASPQGCIIEFILLAKVDVLSSNSSYFLGNSEYVKMSDFTIALD